jgi:hypothetical protein
MPKCYTCVIAICAVLLLSPSPPATAQIDLAWEVYFDPGGYATEVLPPAIDDEGNVYVVARIGNQGTNDMRIAALKINSDGGVVWDTLRDEGVPEWPVAIDCDAWGNAYIVGWTVWGDSTWDILTLKYNPEEAEAEWHQMYDHGGHPFSQDQPTGMVTDDDGNVHISAQVMPGDNGYRRLMMIKYDAAGSLVYNELFSNGGCTGHPYYPCNVFGVLGIIVDWNGNAYTIIEAVGPAPDYWADVYVVRVSPEGAMTSGRYSCGDSDYSWGFAFDREGNSYYAGSALNWDPFEEVYCLFAFNSDLSLRWQKGPDDESLYGYLKTDSQGNLLALKGGGAGGYKLAYDNGEVLCEIPVSTVGRYDLDPFDNVYTNDGGFGLDCYDPQCGHKWHDDFVTDKLVVDDWGNIYAYDAYYGHARVRKWVQAKTLTIKDGSDLQQPIAETDFVLIKVTSDPEPFTEDTLGEFTTDAEGKLVLEPIGGGFFYFEDNDLEVHTLEIGDTLKVGKFVGDSASVKHKSVLGTMYSVFLDNAKFLPEGTMDYDELTVGLQDIIMDHTELRFNLLVSVEWDATLDYLGSMEDGFRSMSSHLYDLTDGQVRLDTVKIYDNKEHWDSADMRVAPSNVFVANANLGGIYSPNERGHRIAMPRKNHFHADEHKMINRTFSEYRISGKLNLDDHSDYGCKAHELGHYAFLFFDEYRAEPPESDWRCRAQGNYGFMDGGQGLAGDPSWRTFTEMSNAYSYSYEDCRNTVQWRGWQMSCWGLLEDTFEKATCGEDELFIPIITPSERDQRGEMPAGDSLCPGPDDPDLSSHIKGLVELPEMHDPPSGCPALMVVTDQYDLPVVDARVWLVKGSGHEQRKIYQGKTAEQTETYPVNVDGGIYVVGKEAGDKVRGEGNLRVTEAMTRANPTLSQAEWHFGEITLDASDSFSVALRPVEGDYPLICGIDLEASTATYWLDISQLFSLDPTVEMIPDEGGQQSYTFYFDGSGYSAGVTDGLGSVGMFTVNAIDDSSFTFFFTTNYTAAEVGDAPLQQLLGPGGKSAVTFDSLNSAIERAALLSSPYPVIPTGLDGSAMQGGETHCLSIYPSATLLGDNVLTISYAQSDVLGADSLNYESSLQIYRWNENQWQMVGGYVDTALDIASAMISEPGVYGAFTTTPAFVRGDANADGVINVADVVCLVNFLYRGGDPPDPIEAGDCTCEGVVDVGDVVFLINYLYRGGDPPSCP